jgi:hypothetical protein
MRRIAIACLVLFLIGQTLPQKTAYSGNDGWIPAVEGISGVDYRFFELFIDPRGPTKVHVARMDRSNQDLTLESALATGKLASGAESVSAMANRYDQSLSNWGTEVGGRSRVLVAINGSYVEPTYAPQSGHVQGGWYTKRFTDWNGSSGFVWKNDRSAFVGECTYHFSDRQTVKMPEIEVEMYFDGINTARRRIDPATEKPQTDRFIVYTHHYDVRTPNYDLSIDDPYDWVEVVVELAKPLELTPASEPVTGYIRDIRDQKSRTTILFDHIVLSAHGTSRSELITNIELFNLEEGIEVEINLSQELQHTAQADCRTPNSNDFSNTYTSVSGHIIFLRDGEVTSGTHNVYSLRDARTAVAYNDDFVYFIVVDGRSLSHSVGMNAVDLGVFARDELGAIGGILQDGGGSSTMVIDGVIVNRTSDSCHRLFLPFLVDPIEAPIILDPVQSFFILQEKCDRRVGNALMMVLVEPMEKSNAFIVGEKFTLAGTTNIRVGPGSNFGVIATVPGGSEGLILAHSNHLEGILAKGEHWQKVSFGNLVGWIFEPAILRKYADLTLWKLVR